MQVILKKEVQNIGEAGDLVNVKDGYARNFLIPKNYAEIATEGALKNREQNIARIRAKQEKLNQEALAKAAELEKIGSIELSAKAGESGKLFGTITTKKLCEEIKAKSNIEIDRKTVSLNAPINKIGEYTCTNQNQVDSNTTTLNNCRLATESFLRETDSNNKETDASASLGWIPIIGSRYAFITDGDTIKLYDFKDNKELANYSEVDTFSYTNASEVTFSNASSVSFIAKSKRTGKYGVAKISADGVKPILEFQFASIKALGNYYVVEEDGKYALYSLEGEKKTSDYNSPVVDYLGSYVKTKKDNAYFVHGFNEEVSSDSYTYVELYNNYYAGVLQNTVEIYDYKGKSITKNLPEKTRSQLKLQINNFYGQGTKAFVITFKSGEYATVKIGTVSGSYDTVIIPLDTTSIGDSNDE